MVAQAVGTSVNPKLAAELFEENRNYRAYTRSGSWRLWDAIGSGRSGLLQKAVGRLGKSKPPASVDAAVASVG